MMKSNGRAPNLFATKLSAILTKFKESSTVHVGHQQARTLFNQFSLRDILSSFISKMDNSQQLNDRQRKQYTYKQEILSDPCYERILESLNKKTTGVSQVISHLCKTLLNRIQNLQQLFSYVSILINIFHNHLQIGKILKQLIQIIDSNVISSFQSQIMIILHQKIGTAKNKSQFLDAILSLVLCLQEKLTVQNQVQNFLIKYLKNDDWNCRKMCVDIGYAILVIYKQIGQNLHSLIKQMKYDKIKHVRDSVNNYEVLYKQIYGEEIIQKSQTMQASIRDTKIRSQYKKTIAKSPIQSATLKEIKRNQDDSSSLDKSMKGKQKNQNFFKNAKNSDVIRVQDDNKSILVDKKLDFDDQSRQNKEGSVPTIKIQQSVNLPKNNFQAYLKKRVSPQSPKQNKSLTPKVTYVKESQMENKQNQIYQNINKIQSSTSNQKNNKFNYQNQFQNFKKKNKISQLDKGNYQESKSAMYPEGSFEQSRQQFSISCIQNKNEANLVQEFKTLLFQFEKRISNRLDRIQKRLDILEQQKKQNQQSLKISKSSKPIQSYQVLQISRIQPDSPKSFFYNQTPNQSGKWQYSSSEGIQSNLQQKVKSSIINQNWDQAFTLALTNNKKNILLNLLERCVFPKDKTVQQCILLQIRKLLDYTSALKWLKYFLMERQMTSSRLQKLRQQLQKRRISQNKNYEMMKQLVLNQIMEKLQVDKN